MKGPTWGTALSWTLLTLSFFFAPATAQTNYTNLLAAIQGQNLTGLASLVALANLTKALSDPNLTATLFAPNNDATESLVLLIDALNASEENATDLLLPILSYHVVPNVSITFRDGQVLPTFLQNLNITNTTKTLSVVADSNGTWYLGGIIPGAKFNVSSRVRAGRSELYIIDGVLFPPSDLLGVPLTVLDWLRNASEYSILSTLITNDALVSNYLSNPNLAVTVFAPNDTAFNNTFRASGLSLGQLIATPTARRILRNHIYPAFPTTEADIPFGVTTLNSTSNSTGTPDTITVNKTRNGTAGDAVMTVRGAGNTGPILVVQTDIAAGMSAVHAIDGVILPRQNSAAGK